MGIFDSFKDKVGKVKKAKDNISVVLKAKSVMEDEALSDAIVDMLEKKYGGMGFMLKVLRERPRTFNPYMLKGMTVYREPVALSKKTAELVAVGASVTLRCEHCLEVHMQRALAEGASMDEIMDAMLVAGSIAESSALSVAFRKFKQQEGKLKNKDKDL